MIEATAAIRNEEGRLIGIRVSRAPEPGPRYAYFEDKRGYMYCWTTAPMEGRYASWVYVPVGKGSRSGDPWRWTMRREVIHAKRKTAKARALRLLRQAEGKS